MANKRERFPYVQRTPQFSAPYLSICLHGVTTSLEELALVDSGATLSILPRSMGEKLGLNWLKATSLGKIAAASGAPEGRSARVKCQFGTLEPVTLGFAWIENDSVPLVLGQVDFFRQFKICFFESEREFEISELR